jgi:hypothetical protein
VKITVLGCIISLQKDVGGSIYRAVVFCECVPCISVMLAAEIFILCVSVCNVRVFLTSNLESTE